MRGTGSAGSGAGLPKTIARSLVLTSRSPGPAVRRPRSRSSPLPNRLTIPVPSPAASLLERYEAWGGISRGTFPEFLAYTWLTDRKKLTEGADFLFQSSQFGGRRTFGGAVIDFLLVRTDVVWRIQGERFHLLEPASRTHDILQKILLVDQGFTVVDIWVDDLLTRTDYVLENAYEGREVGGAALKALTG